ncbi:MAG: hypothetical protein HZA22_04755 [Nitrospirae bacterium]|nr:hypothetical protein [Nitrospirota bacterium]
MRTATAAFLAEQAKTGNSPRTLTVWHFPSPTGDKLVSDEALTPSGGPGTFEALVTNWGAINSRVNPDPLTFDTSDWRLTLANDGATPFSSYLKTYDPLEVDVDVYHWYEGTAYSDKLQIAAFTCRDVPGYSAEEVIVDLASRMEKYDKPLLPVMDRATYPQVDPDDEGRPEPLWFGEKKLIRLPCILGGAVGTLKDNPLTSAATKVYPTIAPTKIAFPTSYPHYFWIDGERIKANSGGTDAGGFYWNITRAQSGGTAAMQHEKGALIRADRNDFSFLANCKPMYSMDTLCVKVGEQFIEVPAASWTDYTGKTGDNHPTWPGKGIVVVTNDEALKKAVALAANASESGHSHNVGYNRTTVNASLVSSSPPSGWSTGGTSKDNVGDANDSTLYSLDNVGGSAFSGSITVNFPSWNGATPLSVMVYMKYFWYSSVQPADATHYLKLNGTTVAIKSPTEGIESLSLGTSVPSSISVSYYNSSGTSNIDIYEVWLEVVTDSTASANAGVSASLSGNSVADTVLPDGVYLSGKGCLDDASGTYTGVANALVEKCEDVIHYAAVAVGGVPSAYVDTTSFGTAGTALAAAISGGYKFAGVQQEQINLKPFLARLAYQCRSRVFESGGKLKLLFRPAAGSAGASVKSFSKEHMVFGSVRPGRTSKDEIINDFLVYYDPDMSRDDAPDKDSCKLCDATTAYPKGGDTTSVGKIGRKEKEHVFDFVVNEDQAKDLRDFTIGKEISRKDRVAVDVFEAELLERGDVVDLTHDAPHLAYSGLKAEVETPNYYPGSSKSKRPYIVQMTAVETS